MKRRRAGLRQIAASAGVSHDTINRIIKGQAVTRRTALKISVKLNIPLREFRLQRDGRGRGKKVDGDFQAIRDFKAKLTARLRG
jgi:transcriptional regulator with XRE-family HTH domain